MHINYRYLLKWAETITNKKPEAKILDYGCGSGQIVIAARERGFEAYGADVFYAGSGSKTEVERLGVLGNLITEIKGGIIDYDNQSFDLVMSNQVFEHVKDLEEVLHEIHRVMKNDAILISLFPPKDILREGHIGIPFAHWFSKNSRARFYYTLFLRYLGFGYHKQNKKRAQWTRDALMWIDNYTVYRSRSEIFNTFKKYYEIQFIEDDYIKFRLKSKSFTKPLVSLFRLPLVKPLACVLFRKLGGFVIIATKRA